MKGVLSAQQAQLGACNLTNVHCIAQRAFNGGDECHAVVDSTPQDVKVWELVARILLWISRNDVPKSGTHLEVVRIVDWPIDALAGIPRKGGMTRHAKHLVAAIHLGDVYATLGTLLCVSSQLLHGRNVVVGADMANWPGFIVRRIGCFGVNRLMTTVARGLITTSARRDFLGDKTPTLGRIARHVTLLWVSFQDDVRVELGFTDTSKQIEFMNLFLFQALG